MNSNWIGFAALWLSATAAAIGADPKSEDTMRCSPKRVTQHSVLTIVLPYPHGGYFMAVHESDVVGTFIVYPHPAGRLDISPETFATMREIQFKVADIKGHDGRALSPVFDKPGRYRLIVGRDFETGFGEPDGACEITYAAG